MGRGVASILDAGDAGMMIAPLSSDADVGGMHAVSNANARSTMTDSFNKNYLLFQHNFKKLFETGIRVQPILGKMIA